MFIFSMVRAMPSIKTKFAAIVSKEMAALPFWQKIWFYGGMVTLVVLQIVFDFDSMWPIGLSGWAIVWTIGAAILAWKVHRRAARRHKDVFEAMQNGGRFQVCQSCRYDLRNASSDHCPECGEPSVFEITDVDWTSK